MNVPVFVVTHSVPQEWFHEGPLFTFVTDGVWSAVERAKAVPGNTDTDVGVGG